MYWSISRVRMDFDIIIILLTFGCFRALSEDIDDSAENTTSRIVGGFLADIKDFPWQVSITYKDQHNCGGSILNEKHILTAAHCTHGLSIKRMTVRVGSNFRDRGGFVYRIATVQEHPEYKKRDFTYDVAILKLIGKLSFSEEIQQVSLPDVSFPELEPDTFATVSGFGQMSAKNKRMSSRLRAVDVPIISKKECRRKYLGYEINESMLCAKYPDGGKDACAGDSGGPLTLFDVQIGIVSWGIGCASSKYPGVYASVSRVIDFITWAADM